MHIDSHQHFWQYNPNEHVWMTDEMAVLKSDFLPENLRHLLDSINFDGSIAIQARQLVKETEWLLGLSDRYDFIKGVVGWVDLRSPEAGYQLERYSKHQKLKGVRHVIHDEADDNFMLGDEFQEGIGLLEQYNLTYDLLLFPRHLPVAVKFVEKFPKQPFVVDHISKPLIKDKITSPWAEDLRELARAKNVHCKLSGMVTEADWNQWKAEDFEPYIDIVFEVFGIERVMIGSDWPVCTLCGDYKSVMNIVINYIQQFPTNVQNMILGENCARFYGVNTGQF